MSTRDLATQSLRNNQSIDLLSRKISAVGVLQEENNKLQHNFNKHLPELDERIDEVTQLVVNVRSEVHDRLETIKQQTISSEANFQTLQSIQQRLASVPELYGKVEFDVKTYQSQMDDMYVKLQDVHKIISQIEWLLSPENDQGVIQQLDNLVNDYRTYASKLIDNNRTAQGIIEKTKNFIDTVYLISENIDSESIIIEKDMSTIRQRITAIEDRIDPSMAAPSIDDVRSLFEQESIPALTPEDLHKMDVLFGIQTARFPQPYDENTTLVPYPANDDYEEYEEQTDEEQPKAKLGGFFNRIFGGGTK